MTHVSASPFDAIADTYDRVWTEAPSGIAQRSLVWRIVEPYFRGLHSVLDVGCGAGRFAEIALRTGAKVVALDYSTAVDACYANLGHHENLEVVQGDVYALPFVGRSFPFVYSLGVLQHTPDVRTAFAALRGRRRSPPRSAASTRHRTSPIPAMRSSRANRASAT